MNALLLIDVATSGLDPKKDALLEIALLLVSGDPTLEVIESASHVIYHSDSGGEITAPAFHRDLILECQDPVGTGEELRKVEAKLLAGPWARATRLVGRGPDFERKFLAAHMPTFARGLPSQTLDINQVEFFAATIGGMPLVERAAARTYRAEDDVVDAYEALRHYQPGRN